MGFENLKQPTATGKADVIEIKYADFKVNEGETFRLVGNVHPAYRYWVASKEDPTKTLPIIAAGFNPETEEWDFIERDPLASMAESKFLRKEFYYTVNAIDRKDGRMKILPLKLTVYKQLFDLVKQPGYGDMTHPKDGYDITIIKTKTGAKPQNVSYKVIPSRNNTPLTPEEQALPLYDLPMLIKPHQNYIDYITEKAYVMSEASLDYV